MTRTGPATVLIRPIGDVIEHTETDDCVCGPTSTLERSGPDVWLITHHALDGRV